ncbi:uracil-xanthine permease [Erysipelotrichaceae bacterium Oil+RF-744-GAM-WT-6]|uniref:Uracil-xanthine permease n=1 Tax=Stecheria intestinalis TaxID=2606630 RepID=A0A7X2TEV9_9FIRM|nr:MULTISPECIES: solute carrier family 23 protein [Erysipelotrichaceae]MDY3233367.1 solute carrier family 23 protein [Erysipelotrichaceae bacterium]MDY4682555.1 solute carrier family 23 protein [Lachnospiraceae bacterium]MCI6745333.1 uracil-xanthine permease [Anaerolactibacter massiliensis]MDD5882350.1 solute carrier family 23 protein [Stecheria intestinalis]MDD6366525.1 solute carrier family 23 protein [Stecheria intestinalis]
MKLTYGVNDKPAFPQLIVYAFQQVLAIMAATITVPMVVGNGMSTAAALFGAGLGTLTYVLFTKKKSPVFLGSSFAFIGSMTAAFAGAVSLQAGYAGLIIGAIFAGLVYVVLAIAVKASGTGWIDRLMPAVVIGPTVSIIGLSLAGSAISNLQVSSATGAQTNIAILCGIIALFATMLASTYGNSHIRMIPFIIGILCGYAVALIFTLIGNSTGNADLQIISFQSFQALSEGGITLKTFLQVPDFTFLTAAQGFSQIDAEYLGVLFMAYVPVAFVVFAEHIADHKNISSIIDADLLKDPGLDHTLLGDGIGSMVGAFFGGCPNTTYGESIACVAITRNASTATIIAAAVECIILSFFSPIVAFISSIPSCVMGGVCMALYGFIAVSGLKMIQNVDLEEGRNLFVVSVILIAGIGGLSLNFSHVTLTAVATALILGIVVNKMLGAPKKN